MELNLDDISKRADSYKFLSECYYLPDEKFIQKVIDISKKDTFFAELEGCLPSTLEFESLKVDFTQLFVGPFKLLAPPYGSVYLEDSGIMGESTIDVKNWYEDEGLDVVINGPPDYIAMELEFMYYLVAKQIQAIEGGSSQEGLLCQQKQKSFLSSHLSRWLPGFAENVRKNAQTKFYRELARLTEIYIQSEIKACV